MAKDLYDILLDMFGEEYKTKGGQFRINCINPECSDNSGNLEISIDKKVFHCWKCDYRGTIYKFFKDYLGYVPVLEDYVSIEDLKKTSLEEEKIIAKVDSLRQVIPLEYIPLTASDLSYVGKKALSYALTRMSKTQIERYSVGYCGLGKYKWRIIIPVFEHGKAIYFTARAFMGGMIPYKNPFAEDLGGVGKENIVFNIDGARRHKRAIICEGVFDAIKVGEDGVAIFGTYLHEEQFKKMLTIPEFYVMLDDDAKNKAIKIAEKIRGKIRNVKLVFLPSGDPSDWSTEFLRTQISSAKNFDQLELFEL